MPDPQMTREWSPRPEGGEDEVSREAVSLMPADEMETRTYAARPEGGPDELARGGDEFSETVLKQREATAESHAADRESLLGKMSDPTPPADTRAEAVKEAKKQVKK